MWLCTMRTSFNCQLQGFFWLLANRGDLVYPIRPLIPRSSCPDTWGMGKIFCWTVGWGAFSSCYGKIIALIWNKSGADRANSPFPALFVSQKCLLLEILKELASCPGFVTSFGHLTVAFSVSNDTKYSELHVNGGVNSFFIMFQTWHSSKKDLLASSVFSYNILAIAQGGATLLAMIDASKRGLLCSGWYRRYFHSSWNKSAFWGPQYERLPVAGFLDNRLNYVLSYFV